MEIRTRFMGWHAPYNIDKFQVKCDCGTDKPPVIFLEWEPSGIRFYIHCFECNYETPVHFSNN